MTELREDVQHTLDAAHARIDSALACATDPSTQDLCLALSELTSIVTYLARMQSHPSPVFTRANDRVVTGLALVLLLGVVGVVAWQFWR